MATIPTGQKFHTVKSTVDTENRGSASLNAQRTIFTMQDILDTVVVGGGVDGSGTAGKISKWVDSNTLTDSIMAETAGLITLTGALNLTGEIQCNSITSSGDIAAVSSNITGVNITASGNIAGVAGLFSGDVSGVAGTFSGAVSGTTGTFSGLMTSATADINGVANIQGVLTLQSNLIVAGNISGPTSITSGGKITGASLAVSTLGIAPASPTAAGELGTVIIALDGIYVAVGVNTWLKAPLVTF